MRRDTGRPLGRWDGAVAAGLLRLETSLTGRSAGRADMCATSTTGVVVTTSCVVVAAIMGTASSPSNVTTFSTAGVTAVGAASGASFVFVVSSRATAGAVGDSITAGMAAVSSTVGGGSTSVAADWTDISRVIVILAPVVIDLIIGRVEPGLVSCFNLMCNISILHIISLDDKAWVS